MEPANTQNGRGALNGNESEACGRVRRALKKFFGIEQDGDGTVVSEFQRHVRLKNARARADAEGLQSLYEFFVEEFALLGRCGLDEAGAPLAARIAVQSKLRDGQDRAADIEQRKIHFSLRVIEDAQLDDFFGHFSGGVGSIVASDGDERDEALADFASDAAID